MDRDIQMTDWQVERKMPIEVGTYARVFTSSPIPKQDFVTLAPLMERKVYGHVGVSIFARVVMEITSF